MTASKYDDIEYLCSITEEVGRDFVAERHELRERLLPTLTPEQLRIYNELDDLAIAETNAVQSRTVEKVLSDLMPNPPKEADC